MTARSRMALSVLWGLAIAGALAGTVLSAVNGWPLRFDPWGLMTLGALTIGSLGALVAWRKPGNAIGWLMLVMGAVDGLASFGLQYGYRGTFGDGLWASELVATLPFGVAIGIVFGLTITFFLLLFPDGRLPSRRWLPVAVIAGAGILSMTAGLAWYVISIGPEELFDQLSTGFLQADRARGAPRILNEVGHLFVFLAFPFAVASLFVRRRRADQVERHQLRWFAYGAVAFFVSIFAPLPDPLGLWFEVAATTFLFAAIGIAILRYRLYEIDRLVSRTVSYAAVTALLVGLYLGTVFLVQLVLPAQSDLATAASTLAVAAAFNPVRRRVQAAVDRRFNRARYDAARTVEEFTRSLQTVAEMEVLAAELEEVTASVMEPTHMSVWVKEET